MVGRGHVYDLGQGLIRVDNTKTRDDMYKSTECNDRLLARSLSNCKCVADSVIA